MDFDFAFGLRKRYLLWRHGHTNETVPQIPVVFECRAFRGADIKLILQKRTREMYSACSFRACSLVQQEMLMLTVTCVVGFML